MTDGNMQWLETIITTVEQQEAARKANAPRGPLWLDRKEYRTAPGLSNSELKAFAEDRELYKLGIRRERTEAIQFGIDLEDYLFTGDIDAWVVDDAAYKVKRGKAYEAAIASIPAGARLLKTEQHARVLESLKWAEQQLRDHGQAGAFLFRRERPKPWPSFFWKCDLTHVERKCELDLLYPTAIVDLKTTADVSLNAFEKQAEELKYHWQAATYQEGVEVATGRRLPVVFVCVKNKPPHNVEVYEMDQAWIDSGAQESLEAIGDWLVCESKGIWRSPTWGRIVMAHRPRWARWRQDVSGFDEL